MRELSLGVIKQFQTKILTWFAKNRRDLPWRQTREPYKILVSEIMLQQTQVSRVIPKYEAWLKAFPTIDALSKASISHVLRAWSGLGYNRRALYLRKTAEILYNHYKIYKNYNYYKDEKTLQLLPGIGEYTAKAILCFAFNKQVAVVDTNVRKVILSVVIPNLFRDLGSNKMLKQVQHDMNTMTTKQIQKIANQLLPHGRAYDWNHALMDYAASVLKKEKILPLRGILLRKTKQSRFIGSKRYYRGQIIKLLLEREKIEIKRLGSLIKANFSTHDKEWLKHIVTSLIHDGLIQSRKESLTLT